MKRKIKKKFTNAFLIFTYSLSLIPNSFLASESPTNKSPNATRISFGTGASFYLINTHHAKRGSQNPSFYFSVKRELKADKSFKTYFAFGIEYFAHGLNLNSYYFKKDSIKIYDKSTMNYRYNLLIQELGLPLQLKILLKPAHNSLFSPYVCASYHLRYLLNTHLNVYQGNKKIIGDELDLSFKNFPGYNKLNSFLGLSIGWQKNNLANSKHSYFMELNFKYSLSPYIFQTAYSPSSMWINGNHLNLVMGFKF
jgi:hypothetical protein